MSKDTKSIVKENETFLLWNHPLRFDAEEMVTLYNSYCQTHLASDNKKYLAELFLEFLKSHNS